MSGEITQKAALDRLVYRTFRLLVQANEDSSSNRFETAELTITVAPANTYPPTLRSSLGVFSGYVYENSLRNTFVKDQLGTEPLRIIATDPDQVG